MITLVFRDVRGLRPIANTNRLVLKKGYRYAKGGKVVKAKAKGEGKVKI